MFGKPIKLQLLIFTQNNPTNVFYCILYTQTHRCERSVCKRKHKCCCCCCCCWFLFIRFSEPYDWLERNMDLKGNFEISLPKELNKETSRRRFLIAFFHFLFFLIILMEMPGPWRATHTYSYCETVVIYCLGEHFFFLLHSLSFI